MRSGSERSQLASFELVTLPVIDVSVTSPEMMTPCSFGYGYPGGVQHPGEETEDEFAQRIWREMQRRKQPAAGPTAATQEAWGAADEAAKQRDVSLSLLTTHAPIMHNGQSLSTLGLTHGRAQYAHCTDNPSTLFHKDELTELKRICRQEPGRLKNAPERSWMRRRPKMPPGDRLSRW